MKKSDPPKARIAYLRPMVLVVGISTAYDCAEKTFIKARTAKVVRPKISPANLRSHTDRTIVSRRCTF